MVSMLSNTGLKYCINQNPSDSLSQFPYLFYDTYPYLPNVPRMDSQQNHLYSQGKQPAVEPKKTKRPKKKAGNEKAAKESSSSLDYSKEDLFKWLKSLSPEERFEAFSINNRWLAVAFGKMYKRWAEKNDTVFALYMEENKKLSCDKNTLEFGDIENHFYCRRSLNLETSEKQLCIERAEKEIVENVRIHDDDVDFFNTIVFREELLQNVDKIIELFEIISDKMVFKKPYTSTAEQNTKTTASDSPLWFNSNSFQTFGAWIVSNFEKVIWNKYLHTRKNTAKSYSSFEVLDFKISFKNKKSLIEFWKGIDKSKKKKLVSAANEMFKYLTNQDTDLKPSENGKEINQKLKTLYESALFEKNVTPENINTYFSHLLEEQNEVTVIETILTTSLDRFGTVQSLICRKLAHKLRNMLSEKIASDLILNEEREKKNNSKKKASKKKKAKKTAQQNTANDNTVSQPNDQVEGISIVIGNASPRVQAAGHDIEANANIDEIRIDIPDEEEKTNSDYVFGQHTWENYVLLPQTPPKDDRLEGEVTHIKDLESQQTFAVVEVRKSQENFVNHLADISTTNGSDAEEKFDQDSKNQDRDEDNAKTIISSNIKIVEAGVEKSHKDQAVKESDEKSGAKTTDNKGTKKNDGIIDDWSLFEEFDKKISKSQKKKQKKRSKKKAEQELQKAQEEEQQKQEAETATAQADDISDNEEKVEEISVQEEKVVDVAQSKPKKGQDVKNGLQNNRLIQTKETKPVESNQDSMSTSRKTSSELSLHSKSENDCSTKISINKELDNEASSSVKFKEVSMKDTWGDDTSTKSTAASTVTAAFDDTGFIEVKSKKKPEKEKKPKSKKDAKDGWRKKKEREPVEKRKPVKEKEKEKEIQKELSKPKAPLKPIQIKKETPETVLVKSHSMNEKTTPAIVEKTPEIETPHKSNIGISKIIINPSYSSKVHAPKPVKTVPQNDINCGSSNSSESESTSSKTRNRSNNSHSSTTQSMQTINPTPTPTPEQTVTQSSRNYRSHPLSIASPCIDLEAIRIAKAKDFANEFFNKKFENDIYKHVAALTEEANKMMDRRILAYKRLDYCIGSLFPNFNVKTKIFGSCATGLALTTSDVDIAVSGIEAYDRYSLCEYLMLISNTLKNFKWVTSNKPILTANVPILKLEIDPNVDFAELFDNQIDKKAFGIRLDEGEKLDLSNKTSLSDVMVRVDLSLEGLGIMGYNFHIGYKTTDFVQRMLHKYESLYIVTMVLKEFLNKRDHLNIYQGGISSYCLVIMIVAYFQKFGDEGFMTALRKFLSFYGETFKPESTGITLLESDPFFPLNHSFETAPLWIIEHSTFARKNIGQGSYAIKVILHEFEKASKTIEYLKQRLEDILIKHPDMLASMDDIHKIDNPELKALIDSNILELFI